MPNEIKKEIKVTVFRKADEHDYMNRTRPDNARFMQDLVDDPEVGVKLASYMEKSAIKTYIKDGILNQYSKQKMRAPADLSALLQKELGASDCVQIDNDKARKISLYTGEGCSYVVACGTYLKWESALRKALEYATGIKEGSKFQIVLVLSIQSVHATVSDMELTKKALEHIGVKCVFAKV